MTLNEAKRVVEIVSSQLSDEARVIWGAQIQEDMEHMIRTMLIVTGVQSSQMFGKKNKLSSKNQSEMEKELGIEFVR